MLLYKIKFVYTCWQEFVICNLINEVLKTLLNLKLLGQLRHIGTKKKVEKKPRRPAQRSAKTGPVKLHPQKVCNFDFNDRRNLRYHFSPREDCTRYALR